MASSSRAFFILFLALFACALGGCGDKEQPNTPPPKFSAIYDDILFAKCATAGCHGNVGGGSAGNLDLSTRDKAHAALVNRDAAGPECKDSALKRVTPAEPEQSLLYAKLAGSPPCGDPMPLGGMLSSSELAAIEDWIAAGALDE